ncbi:hypothetical protein [Aureimonas psammosilenae]|uniref:hypothetical protein n=1 Tax=Aureimonas psammosilenae TaxID=2495496 RepID=UPI00126121D0|nr:hypothetical protein [Aureimonas psammosilenae]
MATVRPRISIPDEVWTAVEEAAKFRRIHPSTFVEQALIRALDPSNEIEALTRMVRELSVNTSSVHDKINYLADYVVDRYRSENEE